MVRFFKIWWAWNYEDIEEWLEKIEAGGLRLVETRLWGVLFYFERCQPAKARYCVDYQTKLTPDYLTIINDDGWKLYQIGMGWYILRKEYDKDRPNLYTDFEALIERNRSMLIIILVLLIFELIILGNLIYNTWEEPFVGWIAYSCILGAVIVSSFAFIITNLALQIKKFTDKKH